MSKSAIPFPVTRSPGGRKHSMKTFALALGGGGARGLAHVAVIEALDEMGIRPVAIAGTSIGALIGAAYAAGMRGKDIRHYVVALAHKPGEIRRRLMKARAGTLAQFFSGAFSQATLMDAEKFCAQFLPEAVPQDFAALQIPLTVIATDLHRRREGAFTSGPLHQALASSIAIPGLFRPVAIGSCILVDGGATNPLPFDQVRERADEVPRSIERLAQVARASAVPMLSHDDASPDERRRFRSLGCRLAEFFLH